jgi:hypothetical protein
MTALRNRVTRLTFETDQTFQGREIVAEARPHTAVLRLKGTRTRYQIPWSTVFDRAAKIAAELAREERKTRRHA